MEFNRPFQCLPTAFGVLFGIFLNFSVFAADPWVTVADNLVPGEKLRAMDLSKGFGGELAVAVQSWGSGNSLVLSSADGKDWRVMDQFQPPTGFSLGGIRLVTGSTGSLFAFSNWIDVNHSSMPFARYTVNGTNWSSLKGDFGFPPYPSDPNVPGSSYFSSAASSINGKLFMAGHALNVRPGWIVTRSDNQGLDWQPVDQFSISQNADCSAHTVAADDKGRIWVGGSCEHINSQSKELQTLLVRMSADDGATWSTVDQLDFSISGLGGYWSAQVLRFAFDPHGKVYYSAQSEGTDGMHWLVRRGEIQSSTDPRLWVWSNADDLIKDPKKEHIPNPAGMAFGGDGSLYVCGDMGWPTYLTIRKTSDGGKSWEVSDMLSAKSHLECNGLITGLSGELFVLGTDYAKGAFIRKLK